VAPNQLRDTIESPRPVVGSSRRTIDHERTERSKREENRDGLHRGHRHRWGTAWLASLIMKTDAQMA